MLPSITHNQRKLKEWKSASSSFEFFLTPMKGNCIKRKVVKLIGEKWAATGSCEWLQWWTNTQWIVASKFVIINNLRVLLTSEWLSYVCLKKVFPDRSFILRIPISKNDFLGFSDISSVICFIRPSTLEKYMEMNERNACHQHIRLLFQAYPLSRYI